MKPFISTFLCLVASVAQAHAITLQASQDTDVYQYTGNRTGTYFSLNVTPSDAHALKSMIQFDLTNVTVGFSANEVDTAILRLYVLAPFGQRERFTAGDVNLYYQTQTWDEISATWNTFAEGAQIGTTHVSAHSTSSSAAYVEIDITTAVKAWLSGTVTNHGLIIRTPTTASGAATSFASREFDTIPELSAFDPNALGPRLIITRAEPDSDGDGYTDAQETAWGSDPNSADGIPVKLEMGSNTLTYNTWSGHRYQLQYSLNLVDWFPLGSAVDGNDGSTSFSIDFSARDDRAEFYRVLDITDAP